MKADPAQTAESANKYFSIKKDKLNFYYAKDPSASIVTSNTGASVVQFVRNVVLNGTMAGGISAPRLVLEEDIDRLDEAHWGGGKQQVGLRFYLAPKVVGVT